MKNGTLEQRVHLQEQHQKERRFSIKAGNALKSSPELKVETAYLKLPPPTNFLDIALAKSSYDPAPTIRNKKRRRKGKQQQQQLSL